MGLYLFNIFTTIPTNGHCRCYSYYIFSQVDKRMGSVQQKKLVIFIGLVRNDEDHTSALDEFSIVVNHGPLENYYNKGSCLF